MIMINSYLLLLFLLPLVPPFLFLVFFATHRWKPKHYNLPPGPRPLPIIGNLHNIGDQPHLSLHSLAQRHGPLMYLKLGRVPTIVVSGAEEVSEILKAQDQIFCSRARLASTYRFSYGGIDVAFSPYDDHWKLVKRLCNSEVFGPARVQSFAAIRGEEVSTLVSTISRASSRGETVNLSDMVLCLFNNVIFREVFGKRPSAEGDCGKMQHQDLLREVMALMGELGAGDLFPSLQWLDVVTGWRAKLDNCFQRLDRLLEDEIGERLKSAGPHEDFLDVLLRLQAREDNSSLSMTEIKAILMNMFTAGTDTSAGTVEWGMTQLMRNPEVMKKATEEVRRAAGDKKRVEESDLQHIHYLRQVIKETLRLNPPGPLLPPRECMQDTMVAGYDVPAGTRVYVNLWSIGRDSQRWPDDPENFRPERFEGSPVNFKGGFPELIPFGGGRRICPGISLAMAGVEMVLANMLCCFDWELPSGMGIEDVDMTQATGINTPKKVPLVLLAKPAAYK